MFLKMDIKIEESALKRIRKRIELSETQFLRLGFRAGGCMGITQFFEPSDEMRPDDLVFEMDGVKMLVDPKSAKLLDGAALRWSSNLLESGMVWDFPGKRQKCSCGASVSL